MIVKPCKCAYDYQDKMYGKGMRVHTPTNKGSRCTVCNVEVSDGASSSKKK